MPPLSRFLWRLFAAALGFLAAVAAAVAIVLVATLLPIVEAPDLAVLHRVADGRMALGLAVLGEVAGRAIFPGWLALALLAEVAGLRALAVHLFGFAAVALLALLGTMPETSGALLRLAAAAGLVGGFAHWLVAGRSAGFAMRPTQANGNETRGGRMSEPGNSE